MSVERELNIMQNNNTVWVVTTPSAYRANHQCFLGSGPTKAKAIEDAYGPKESWGNSTKRAVRNADVYQVTEDECREMQLRN